MTRLWFQRVESLVTPQGHILVERVASFDLQGTEINGDATRHVGAKQGTSFPEEAAMPCRNAARL